MVLNLVPIYQPELRNAMRATLLKGVEDAFLTPHSAVWYLSQAHRLSAICACPKGLGWQPFTVRVM